MSERRGRFPLARRGSSLPGCAALHSVLRVACDTQPSGPQCSAPSRPTSSEPSGKASRLGVVARPCAAEAVGNQGSLRACGSTAELKGRLKWSTPHSAAPACEGGLQPRQGECALPATRSAPRARRCAEPAGFGGTAWGFDTPPPPPMPPLACSAPSWELQLAPGRHSVLVPDDSHPANGRQPHPPPPRISAPLASAPAGLGAWGAAGLTHGGKVSSGSPRLRPRPRPALDPCLVAVRKNVLLAL